MPVIFQGPINHTQMNPKPQYPLSSTIHTFIYVDVYVYTPNAYAWPPYIKFKTFPLGGYYPPLSSYSRPIKHYELL